jgi:hypothetical protein
MRDWKNLNWATWNPNPFSDDYKMLDIVTDWVSDGEMECAFGNKIPMVKCKECGLRKPAKWQIRNKPCPRCEEFEKTKSYFAEIRKAASE